ncbi:MAG: hypothetical protein HY720_13930 [Planctomycetes bacterium]|nr:hypothetical protein [Planctomycetota bacterium]
MKRHMFALLAALALFCPQGRSEETIPLRRLEKKGYHLAVRRLDDQAWNRETAADPALPRTLAELRAYRRRIATGGVHEECAEDAYGRLYVALGNPRLSDADVGQIEADLDGELPALESSYETPEGHFLLRWTNQSAKTSDNIADPAIVENTGAYLEAAWTKYVAKFAKEPYVPAGKTKIEIVFFDIPGFLGVASPPDGPIQFNSAQWVAKPGIRKPTSSHELFHKLQYAFGYKTNPLAESGKWFSEGTASWAEVFATGSVSKAGKVTDLFDVSDIGLIEKTSYNSLPFWIFFESRLQTVPGYCAMVTFLQKYEATGKLEASLTETIVEDGPAQSVYFSDLDDFFALFARERFRGAWRTTPSGAKLYPVILGPDGKPIDPKGTGLDQYFSLSKGQSASFAESVSALGADHHRVIPSGLTAPAKVVIQVDAAPEASLAYMIVWMKDGKYVKFVYPGGAANDYTYQATVEPGTWVFLIVSGREEGGNYSVTMKVE